MSNAVPENSGGGFSTRPDGSVVADPNGTGGQGTGMYASWGWKQIEAAIIGVAANPDKVEVDGKWQDRSQASLEADRQAALLIASPQSLMDAAGDFQYAASALTSVAHDLAGQVNSLVGDQGPWQGPSATAFRELLKSVVTAFDKQVEVIHGGAGGLSPMASKLADAGQYLNWAQHAIVSIDQHYAAESQRIAAAMGREDVVMDNGKIQVNWNQQIVDALDRDMRKVIITLADQYNTTNFSTDIVQVASAGGGGAGPYTPPPPVDQDIPGLETGTLTPSYAALARQADGLPGDLLSARGEPTPAAAAIDGPPPVTDLPPGSADSVPAPTGAGLDPTPAAADLPGDLDPSAAGLDGTPEGSGPAGVGDLSPSAAALDAPAVTSADLGPAPDSSFGGLAGAAPVGPDAASFGDPSGTAGLGVDGPGVGGLGTAGLAPLSAAAISAPPVADSENGRRGVGTGVAPAGLDGVPDPAGLSGPSLDGADVPSPGGADVPSLSGADVPSLGGADVPSLGGADVPSLSGADVSAPPSGGAGLDGSGLDGSGSNSAAVDAPPLSGSDLADVPGLGETTLPAVPGGLSDTSGTTGLSGMPMMPMSPQAGAGTGASDRSDASGLLGGQVEPWQADTAPPGELDGTGTSAGTPESWAADSLTNPAGADLDSPTLNSPALDAPPVSSGLGSGLPMMPMSPQAGAGTGASDRSDASGLLGGQTEPWQADTAPAGELDGTGTTAGTPESWAADSLTNPALDAPALDAPGGNGLGTGVGTGMPMMPMSPQAGNGTGASDRSDASGLLSGQVEPWQADTTPPGELNDTAYTPPGTSGTGPGSGMPMMPMSPQAGAGNGASDRSDASGLLGGQVEPWQADTAPAGELDGTGTTAGTPESWAADSLTNPALDAPPVSSGLGSGLPMMPMSPQAGAGTGASDRSDASGLLGGQTEPWQADTTPAGDPDDTVFTPPGTPGPGAPIPMLPTAARPAEEEDDPAGVSDLLDGVTEPWRSTATAGEIEPPSPAVIDRQESASDLPLPPLPSIPFSTDAPDDTPWSTGTGRTAATSTTSTGSPPDAETVDLVVPVAATTADTDAWDAELAGLCWWGPTGTTTKEGHHD